MVAPEAQLSSQYDHTKSMFCPFRMLVTFKNATMLFYQTYSIGQLLNRFTSDVDIVDLKVSKDV
jgi:hypothetical protein